MIVHVRRTRREPDFSQLLLLLTALGEKEKGFFSAKKNLFSHFSAHISLHSTLWKPFLRLKVHFAPMRRAREDRNRAN